LYRSTSDVCATGVGSRRRSCLRDQAPFPQTSSLALLPPTSSEPQSAHRGKSEKRPGLKATVDKGVLHITGKFDIARKDADLGQESDAGGDYVSLKIGVDVNVTAKAPQ
jgi:hypothetical protein